MKVFNRLTGRKEEFVPLQEGKVGMYICGMTVQDRPHIGHIRSFITGDIMRRYLEFRGYQVKHVQNFTDIDDKIIERANRENVHFAVISNRYIQEFFECVDGMNLLRAHVYPRATEEIPEIIALIQNLITQNFAYEAEGDVFFKVDSFPKYGELSGRKTEELLTGTRFEVDPKKKSPFDFALWKAAKPGEPYWDSPFGQGRPGWHIECSAMAMKYIGKTLDFHGGGLDLIFPHHENEKAQSEAVTGVPFVNYWVESGLLNINGEKMSKSLGNFFAIMDVLKRFAANEIRLFLISGHYRSPLDFGENRLNETRSAYTRITESIGNALRYLQQQGQTFDLQQPQANKIEAGILQHFIDAMDDDFNTALAISQIFDLVKELNIILQTAGDLVRIQTILTAIVGLGQILGFKFEAAKQDVDERFNHLMDLVLAWRLQHRKDKNWAMADRIRDDLASIGIVIEDRPGQSIWKLI